MLLIVNRVPRLFPDILQDKPGQHIFIDGMGGTGALAAAGVVAADERAVPPRPAVLVGKPLHMIPHFESAVRAVDEAGENAFDAVRRLGLPHLFLVNADNRIPNLAGDDRLMGPLHSNPLVLGLCHQLLGFIGEGPAFALDHVPDIGFIAEHA